MAPIVILSGNNAYFLNEAVVAIKKSVREMGDIDEKIIDINKPTDWSLLTEEANSYSLFSDCVLLDLRFDKKSIDAAGKKILGAYLQNINSRCVVIIQAPSLALKQSGWLTENPNVLWVQIDPLLNNALKNWINGQLKSRALTYDTEVPETIYQYSQNNLLACAQILAKLELIYDGSHEITATDVIDQVRDQSEFQLYELTEACLAGDAEKAIYLLKNARNNQAEPILILWLLTQEIRQLIQLSHSLKQAIPFTKACSELKIWPKRVRLYELSVARLPLHSLYQLLRICQELDERIKTSQSPQLWQLFETLALSICKGFIS